MIPNNYYLVMRYLLLLTIALVARINPVEKVGEWGKYYKRFGNC